jgi:hypothetical protein
MPLASRRARILSGVLPTPSEELSGAHAQLWSRERTIESPGLRGQFTKVHDVGSGDQLEGTIGGDCCRLAGFPAGPRRRSEDSQRVRPVRFKGGAGCQEPSGGEEGAAGQGGCSRPIVAWHRTVPSGGGRPGHPKLGGAG